MKEKSTSRVRGGVTPSSTICRPEATVADLPLSSRPPLGSCPSPATSPRGHLHQDSTLSCFVELEGENVFRKHRLGGKQTCGNSVPTIPGQLS